MQWRATVEQCIAVEEEERSCGCGDSGKGIQQSTFLGFAKVKCNPEDLPYHGPPKLTLQPYLSTLLF